MANQSIQELLEQLSQEVDPEARAAIVQAVAGKNNLRGAAKNDACEKLIEHISRIGPNRAGGDHARPDTHALV